MRKQNVVMAILILLITGLLWSSEFYISFDGPYLKSWPAQAPATITDSAGTRNIWCSFTADWDSNGKIGTAGYCFTFSGAYSSDWYYNNQWVRVLDDPVIDPGTSDFGMSFWVKTSSTRYNNTICDKRINQHYADGYLIAIYGGKPLLQISSSTKGWTNYLATTADAVVNDGQWHNISIFVTRNSTTGGNIYVDGKCVLTFNPTKFLNDDIDNTENLYIGRHIASPSANFEGTLDDFHFWKK